MHTLSYLLNLIFIVLIALYAANKHSADLLIFGPDATLPDGSVYSGDIVDAKFHGQGKLVYASGDTLSGEFVDGYVHGQALATYINGDVLKARFERGYASGPGFYTFDDGAEYKGEFKHNYFHGEGTLSYPGGERYSGRFEKGNIVYGEYQDGENNHYQGDFKAFVYHGQGKLSYESGDIYEGQFVDGVLSGHGKLSGADGRSYEGEFEHNAFHGQGKLNYVDNSYYEGAFEYGMMHGQGKLVQINSDGEEEVQEGLWEYDFFTESSGEQPYQPHYADELIYQQRDLLSKSEQALINNDPEKIDFYFLGLAGDGSQNVFKNEILSLNKQFAEQYQTEGKSVLLINHVDTENNYALATKKSLAMALNSIKQKMDVENDVLILYMTSHGGEDHSFYLNDVRVNLQSLTADELKQALAESGIKWKAALISSCYSGGHIKNLQDEYTMVLTSARQDKASFGCSYNADMTYFGRTLSSAMTRGVLFFDAFAEIQQDVKKMELDNDIDNHSLPQQFIGKQLQEHLHRWRIQQSAAIGKVGA
ncbi:C13 family peptidase [Agaribacterium haliotis]|uniref:C13 family peptidase n=1 Tax=Agaribacterium haliotis TaxID=2013869 RepID=UPI0013040F47|nr:C13 family peptidase [Agaribacterium haliotis]